MEHYIYIIQSQTDNSFYKGYSMSPAMRLLQHNNKESAYTSKKTPWQLVYVERCGNKTEALKREKAVKKYSHAQIEILMRSAKNVVHLFLSEGEKNKNE